MMRRIQPARWTRSLFAFVVLWLFASASHAQAPLVASRIVDPVNDADTVTLTGNTNVSARPALDGGAAPGDQVLNHMHIMLRRSVEQERALADFNARQYDPNSADYHHWLHAEEFGRTYGPSDGDIAAISAWLKNKGLDVYGVGKGRITVEFYGTVAKVQEAFHVQMHQYLVDGELHVANDRDPQIPQALAPVISGIAWLSDFRPQPHQVNSRSVSRNLKTGKTIAAGADVPGIVPAQTGAPQPLVGYVYNGQQHEDLTPYDFATIYNSLPLWNASTPIIGTNVSVAIAGGSDIVLQDIATFRSVFKLPAKVPKIIYNPTNPGQQTDWSENTLDTEMVSASAPGADIILVASTSAEGGFLGSALYIIDNETAPIMSASYQLCELTLTTSNNQYFNSLWQQGATEGISIFVASDDIGSAGCSSQAGPKGNGVAPWEDTEGLQVNGIASTPYTTAVGGTDFNWSYGKSGPTTYSTYWNSQADSEEATAKGYIPEIPWNSTCANPIILGDFTTSGGQPFTSNEELCNRALANTSDNPLVVVTGGGGGYSHCTVTTNGVCSGGYAKPSWQTGTGVPADGKRDVPDVALFASGGWNSGFIDSSAILVCFSGDVSPCAYSSVDDVLLQETGGTSAASPYMAGVMAMITQKAGGAKQGLANPTLYKLAAKESLSECNSSTVTNGNSCVFYDITQGSNAQVCVTGGPDCVTNTSGDKLGLLGGYPAGTGYDLASGLGSVNITNLVNAWTSSAPTPTVTVSPTSLTFPSTAVGSTSAAQVATLKNAGSVTVSISAVSLSGGSADDYVLTTTCGSSLAVGASCTASVKFKPVSTGAKATSIHFADSASGSPQSVSLTGTGTAAGSSPAVTLSPTSVTFSSQTVGTTSAAQTVKLTNSGKASLSITSIALTGGEADDFVLTKGCGSSLAAGASCTLSISFKPASSGTKKEAITITDNASGSPQSVSLTGSGSAAGSSPAVTLSPTSETFSSRTVGTTSGARTVKLTNSGGASLSITSIALTGGEADDFVLTKGCGSSLAASASCTLSVSFKPASSGLKKATIAVADNASGSPQSVGLSGTGVATTAVQAVSAH
jgi:hypothetical protein